MSGFAIFTAYPRKKKKAVVLLYAFAIAARCMPATADYSRLSCTCQLLFYNERNFCNKL